MIRPVKWAEKKNSRLRLVKEKRKREKKRNNGAAVKTCRKI